MILKEVKPVGEWCLIERDPVSNKKGVIELPDGAREYTSLARLLKVGPRVKLPKFNEDEIVLLPPKAPKKRQVQFKYPYDFCDFVNYKDIFAYYRNEIVIPIGNKKVLVQRLNEEYLSKGGIIIPGAQPSTDQTLWVKFVRRGLLREGQHWSVPVMPGDICKLEKWSENMTEIELMNGEYGLIVSENSLQYVDNERPEASLPSNR